MIPYVGGKTQLVRYIAPFIRGEVIKRQAIWGEDKVCYIEPFVGGCSMMTALHDICIAREAYDINEDLIHFYKDLQDGWIPPEHVDEKTYRDMLIQSFYSPLKVYTGFGCSFAGKWFGGYARDRTGKRDIPNEVYWRIMKNRNYIEDVYFDYASFENLYPQYTDVVYCDPPYAGTLGYKNKFDHELFWDTMRLWKRKGVKVFISEFNAPEDFTCIWSRERKISVDNSHPKNVKTERLFI